MDDRLQLAAAELEHAAPKGVVRLHRQLLKALDLGAADRLLAGHHLVQALELQPPEKVEPGQEFDTDMAQVASDPSVLAVKNPSGF